MNATQPSALRRLRNKLNMFYRRHQLARIDFKSGLGESAWLLYGVVRAVRSNVCVEIGSSTGWSTCITALALEENVHGRLYAIDPHLANDWSDVPGDTLATLRANLARIRLAHRVEIVVMKSAAAVDSIPSSIDLLFIDGDHSYRGVKADWDLFSPKLAPWGVAVFHDSLWEHITAPHILEHKHPDTGVPAFLDELRQAGYPIITLQSGVGLTLVQGRRQGIPLIPVSG